MKNMEKGLTGPKWAQKNRLKIPQMTENLSAQFVCPSRKVRDFDEKRLHRASVVGALAFCIGLSAALIISSFFIEVQQIIDFVILSLLTPEFIHLQSYVSLLVILVSKQRISDPLPKGKQRSACL
jgi:hypothetical protein